METWWVYQAALTKRWFIISHPRNDDSFEVVRKSDYDALQAKYDLLVLKNKTVVSVDGVPVGGGGTGGGGQGSFCNNAIMGGPAGVVPSGDMTS